MNYHTKVSFIKSLIRIIGYFSAGVLAPHILVPMFILAGAEILGIAEELGE
jgi:hypothetical protein